MNIGRSGSIWAEGDSISGFRMTAIMGEYVETVLDQGLFEFPALEILIHCPGVNEFCGGARAPQPGEQTGSGYSLHERDESIACHIHSPL
jgi:hypothetical protein